jgi:hypothetical protein
VRGQYRGRKPEGQEHVRREIQNTKVRREKKVRGRKDLHRLFFSCSQIFIIILIG